MHIADELASSYANQDERYDDEMPQEAHRIAKHLLLQIEIVNGKRTGVFADLKTTEVADAEKKEGGYVIRVAEGKTFRYSGYANIFLSAAEMRLMRQYIGIIRKQFHPKTDQVLCRVTEERAHPNEIGDLICCAIVLFLIWHTLRYVLHPNHNKKGV